ncbi:MAG: hypothetical protein ACJ76P_08290 [Actinomycetota bacterium]
MSPKRRKGSLDLASIETAAREQGWRIDRTTAGHPRFTPPDVTKRPCTFSGTPGDVRAIRNFLSCLRKSGLVWPWPP